MIQIYGNGIVNQSIDENLVEYVAGQSHIVQPNQTIQM
jgi:hypothetical protein